MAKIHIAKSEDTKRAEERRARVEEIKRKKEPKTNDVIQLLGDVWDELQDIKKKL